MIEHIKPWINNDIRLTCPCQITRDTRTNNPAAPEVQQPNNFIPQQALPGHFNAAPPPPLQQQQHASQYQRQQAQYPPLANAQQQHQQMPQYAHASPLAQGQGFATPLDDGHDGAGNDRKNSLVRAKLQFKGRDIWVGGESSVGRKGKDGEWTEVRGCSVM